MTWFKRLFNKKGGPAITTPTEKLNEAESTSLPAVPATPPGATHIEKVIPRPVIHSEEEGQAYLEKLRNKINALAEKFAAGSINRRQFEDLYRHYQQEIMQVESLLLINPNTDQWKDAVTEGQSILIRRRAASKIIGYSIYDHFSGMPLKTKGEFLVEPELFIPMLSSYQNASEEIFGGGMQTMQIVGGRWLCFIPGKFTTTMVLLSNEPSKKQMDILGEVHKVFEQANSRLLSKPPARPDELTYPHDFFLTNSF